jgi:chromosome segregation ATPase
MEIMKMEDNLILDENFVNTYIRKLKEHLDDYHGQTVILQAKVAIYSEMTSNFQKEKAELISNVETLQQTCSDLLAERDHLADLHSSVTSKNDELITSNIGMKSDYDSMLSEKNNLLHALNQAQENIRRLEAEFVPDTVQILDEVVQAVIEAKITDVEWQEAETNPKLQEPKTSRTRNKK